MNTNKIVYFRSGGHISHDIFLENIDHLKFPIKFDEKFYNSKKIIKNILNVRINLKRVENTKYWLLEDIKIKKILDFIYPKTSKDKIFIGLMASPIIYYFLNRKRFSLRQKISHILFGKSLNEVHYFICVSYMVRDYVKLVLKNKEKNFFVVYPSPTQDNISFFSNIKPDLNSNNMIFIGIVVPNLFKRNLDYKGVCILIKAMEYIKEEKLPIRLFIVGRTSTDIIKKYKKDPNIRFLGYLDKNSLKKYIERSSLYVHTAIFDPFAISVIEAMYAGLPVIVSKNTGAKEIVKKVRKDFVVDLDPKRIANKIIEYFNLSYSEKKELSESFRETAKEINPERSAKEFKAIIDKIIN